MTERDEFSEWMDANPETIGRAVFERWVSEVLVVSLEEQGLIERIGDGLARLTDDGLALVMAEEADEG